VSGGPRPLDRWNPLTPLAAAILLVVLAYAGPQPVSPAIALLAGGAGAWGAGVGRRVGWLVAGVAVPTFLLLVLLAVVVPPSGAREMLGPIAWSPAAVAEAGGIALRLGAAVAALGVIVAGVPPRRLTRALAQRGLPAWGAYVLVASLEAVPEARRRAQEVLDAQRCRGLAVGGGPLGRARALVPLAGPLVVSLVTESEERALALDARAFEPRGRRTALDPIADGRGERAFRLAMWLGVVALIAWGWLRV
jgi:energy-coupling factor transport system permease protein